MNFSREFANLACEFCLCYNTYNAKLRIAAAAKGTKAVSGNRGGLLLRLDSDTFYIYHVAAVMVDNLRRLLLGINLSDKAVMDFDFPGVGFPV